MHKHKRKLQIVENGRFVGLILDQLKDPTKSKWNHINKSYDEKEKDQTQIQTIKLTRIKRKTQTIANNLV
jgi:hypothetical protein